VAYRDTIVVGASAGGVEALRTLLAGLPADLPAAILVVLHTPRTSVSALSSILARATELTVHQAENESPLEHGTVLVARPDHHLVVVDGRVITTRGPQENGHRPAVDVLFRSAARALGPRVVAVILSGALDDGSAGLIAVRRHGGVGVVQDPADALHNGMPINAIRAAAPEHVLPLARIPELLRRLVSEPLDIAAPEPTDLMDTEIAMAELKREALQEPERPGVPAGFSCPECHGTLFQIDEAGFIRYRCLVGHAWSAESLLAESDAALEGAFWAALRSLEEKAALASEMAARAGLRGHDFSAHRFKGQAEEARNAAELIRRMLLNGTGVSTRGGGTPGTGI
jgi:two-component system chemotaxis response regulator CheB